MKSNSTFQWFHPCLLFHVTYGQHQKPHTETIHAYKKVAHTPQDVQTRTWSEKILLEIK